MSLIERLGPFQSTPMLVAVELPCPAITMGDILYLEPGSTLLTDRPAGDTMDVRIGGQLVGRGEMVVTDRAFGLRITKLGEAL